MAASPPETTSLRLRAVLSAAFLVGAAFGIAAAAGTALLLYTGQGFLRAAGVLIAVAIGALTAGLWVGASPEPRARTRWAVALACYLLAAAAVTGWSRSAAARAWPLADAVAMLLVLALPAYSTGVLLAGLATRRRGAGLAAMGGAALGVALAAGSLIPRVDAPVVFAFTATLVLAALVLDWRRAHDTGGSMAGDVVIISGAANRGQLAFSIAQRCVSEQARVVLTGRSDSVAALAAELGPDVIGVSADLLAEGGAAAVVAAALARFGRIDALINTAGGLTLVAPLADTDADALRAEIERNVTTAHNLARAALPALRETRGAIVNFASPAGRNASAQLGAYSAAKAGVIALTRALALEERQHGVRVNAVAPGMLDTPRNRDTASERARFVPREQVADVVWFLISPAARGITGETIAVLGETIR